MKSFRSFTGMVNPDKVVSPLMGSSLFTMGSEPLLCTDEKHVTILDEHGSMEQSNESCEIFNEVTLGDNFKLDGDTESEGETVSCRESEAEASDLDPVSFIPTNVPPNILPIFKSFMSQPSLEENVSFVLDNAIEALSRSSTRDIVCNPSSVAPSTASKAVGNLSNMGIQLPTVEQLMDMSDFDLQLPVNDLKFHALGKCLETSLNRQWYESEEAIMLGTSEKLKDSKKEIHLIHLPTEAKKDTFLLETTSSAKLETTSSARLVKKMVRAKRACIPCHRRKVRCMREDGSSCCVRCAKDPSKCVPFVPTKIHKRPKTPRRRKVVRAPRRKRLSDELNVHKGVPCQRNEQCVRPHKHPGHCKILGESTKRKRLRASLMRVP